MFSNLYRRKFVPEVKRNLSPLIVLKSHLFNQIGRKQALVETRESPSANYSEVFLSTDRTKLFDFSDTAHDRRIKNLCEPLKYYIKHHCYSIKRYSTNDYYSRSTINTCIKPSDVLCKFPANTRALAWGCPRYTSKYYYNARTTILSVYVWSARHSLILTLCHVISLSHSWNTEGCKQINASKCPKEGQRCQALSGRQGLSESLLSNAQIIGQSESHCI